MAVEDKYVPTMNQSRFINQQEQLLVYKNNENL